MKHGWSGTSLAALAVLLLAACREESTPTEEPLAIDMSGVWAGTWSGKNTAQGYVTGTWEASVTQTAAGVTGSIVLGGDVDCPDATLTGTLAGEIVSGKIERPPCYPNEWTMTALDLVRRTTSGVWTQPAWGGQGTFTGAQIARRGGPHISFFGPTAGRPGTIVTIVGRGFDDRPDANLVEVGGMPATVIAASLERLTVLVPEGAGSGAIALTTAYGTTMSPRPFDTDARHPDPEPNSTIAVESAPQGIAFGPDGRRVYVVNGTTSTVSMVDARVNVVLRTTPVHVRETPPVQGVAASPDGRRVYVASGAQGITVLDTALNTVVDAIPVAAGGEGLNPHGVAVSPDGRRLYVSDDRDGGAFSVVDLATKDVVASFSRGPGARPAGVAASPDGRTAFLAFAGAGADVVDVLDADALVTTAAVPVGSQPVGLAVTPDGAKVYVTSAQGGSVTVFDAALAATTIAVGSSPHGIAIGADGTRAYVADKASGSVTVVDTAIGSVETTIASVCTSPVGIAMSPDGKRAFVTCAGDGMIREIGGPYTLTIVKLGTGYGNVTSSPPAEGILCGPSCQARFDRGTVVTLSAAADSSSYFEGWGGDGCAGGSVDMSTNRTCTATFTYIPGNGGSGGGGHCFIATAAFGSELAREVEVLREFRDRHLLTHAPGRAFVRAYYALSPPIANAIARRDGLRAAVRGSLVAVVWAVEQPRDAALSAAAIGLAVLLAIRLRRRPARGTP